MRMVARIVLCCMMSLIIMPSALAEKRRAQRTPNIAGVYGGDFTVGQGSGDLEGMRVVIINAGDAYHAIVQIAEGGAEDPQPNFVPVTVNGRNVEFTVGERKFTGTVTAAGLRLKDEQGLLKRKPCSSYL